MATLLDVLGGTAIVLLIFTCWFQHRTITYNGETIHHLNDAIRTQQETIKTLQTTIRAQQEYIRGGD